MLFCSLQLIPKTGPGISFMFGIAVGLVAVLAMLTISETDPWLVSDFHDLAASSNGLLLASATPSTPSENNLSLAFPTTASPTIPLNASRSLA
jgi:hypothetical protein